MREIASEPTRIVRVTSFDNDTLFALDETGELWSYERRQSKTLWIRLPSLPTLASLRDMYVHLRRTDEECSLRGDLRALDRSGRLWELGWNNGEYLWNEIRLEVR